jgi:carbonic anhydrase/acetyltransferase-like protein (isoleucine patch superfamily)
MSQYPYKEHWPTLPASVFIAPGAYVIGNVTMGENCSVWFGSVVRGDSNRIVFGDGVNVQDNSTVHVDANAPTIIGNNVTLAHRVVVHGSVLEDNVMIAIGAVVLSGCTIGEGSIIGANALVPEGTTIPPHSLVMGVPGKVIREVREHELERMKRTAANYRQNGADYLARIGSSLDTVAALEDELRRLRG